MHPRNADIPSDCNHGSTCRYPRGCKLTVYRHSSCGAILQEGLWSKPLDSFGTFARSCSHSGVVLCGRLWSRRWLWRRRSRWRSLRGLPLALLHGLGMGGRGSRGEGAHLRTCRFFGRTRYTRLCRSHGRGVCRPKTIPSPEVNAYTSASLAGMARGQCKCQVPRPLKPPIVRIYLITEQF